MARQTFEKAEKRSISSHVDRLPGGECCTQIGAGHRRRAPPQRSWGVGRTVARGSSGANHVSFVPESAGRKPPWLRGYRAIMSFVKIESGGFRWNTNGPTSEYGG